MKNTIISALLLTLSLAAQADNGGRLALTTVPPNAKIYINGQIKANTSPVIFSLPVGTHHIEAQANGQRVALDVLITDGTVVSKKMVVIESPPLVYFKSKPFSISELIHPKRDPFETVAEFKRRQQALLKNRQALITLFNQGVQEYNPSYQAGVAYLDKENYDIDSGKFPVRLEWKKWVSDLIDLKKLVLFEKGYIIAKRDKAKALWQEDQQKPVFISFAVLRNKIKVSQQLLVGVGREWVVKLHQPVVELKAGEVFRDRLKDGSDGPEMVVIPAGTFRMGDIQGGGYSDEQPVHQVSVKSFAMSRYEVTFAEYDKFAEATGKSKPGDRGWGRGNRPVIDVSWHDAVAYTQWLSTQTGKTYRLPTAAEWEYAARGGTETKYWWGNESGYNRANCNGCGSQWDGKKTAPVGSFSANPFGLYDTVGNLWEWCADSSHDSYKGAPTEGQVWNGGDESRRVLRGGSWYDSPDLCRSAYRGRYSSDTRYQSFGFRVAVAVRLE